MDRSLRLQVILAALDRASAPLRSVAGQSSATARALAGLETQKKDLNRQLADVAAFRRLKAGLTESEQALEAAQHQAQGLARQLAQTENPTRSLTRETDRARAAVNQAEQALAAKRRELQGLRGNLENAGVSTRDLGGHERRLRTELEQTTSEIREQTRHLDALQDRQARTNRARGRFDRTQQFAGQAAGAGFAALGGGAAIAAPLIQAGRASAALESDLTTIVQRADGGRDAVAGLRTDIIALEGPTNQTRQALTEAMDVLTARGLSPDQATATLSAIGRTATAYGEDVSALADATYSSLTQMEIQAGRAGNALEIMAAAGKAGSFEIGDMAEHFPSLTAQAAALGETGERGLAALSAAAQVVRRQTGDAAGAATNLGNALQKAMSPETERRFARVGINLREELARARAEGRDVYETIVDLTNRATGGDMTLLGRFFADAQAQAGVRALITNIEDYRQIRDQALASTGAIDRDFALRMQDDAEKAEQLRIQAAQLADTFVQGVMPAFRAVRDFALEAAGAFNAWAAEHPKLAQGIGLVVGGIAALLVAFGGIALAVSAVLMPFATLQLGLTLAGPIFAALTGGLMAAVGAVWAFTVALLANPITWIVLAVVALGAVVYLLIRHWDQVTAFFTGLWQRVSQIFADAVAGVMTWLNGFWPGVRDLFSQGVRLVGAVLLAFNPAGLLLIGFSRIWPLLSGFVGRFAQAGRNLIDGLIQGLRDGAGRVIGVVRDMAGRIAAGFRNALGIRSPSRVFMALGGHTMDGLAIGLDRGGQGPLNAVARVGAGMAGALAMATSGPALASGSGLALGAQAPVRAATAPVSTRTYEIHIHAAPGMDPEEIARAVAEELDRRDREAEARQRADFSDGDDGWP